VEKRQIAFFVIAAVILITWVMIGKLIRPPEKKAPAPTEETEGTKQPAPAEGTEEQQPPTETPSEGEAPAETPETPEGPAITTETGGETAPVETPPAFEPVLYRLANPFATFEISTKGGVVRQVVIETKETSPDHGIVIHGDESYFFCADELPQKMYPLALFSVQVGGLDLAEFEFKKVEDESDARTLVLRYEDSRVAVTKTFSLPEEGYRLDVTLAIRNKTGGPIKLPEYSMQVGTVYPVDPNERRPETRITLMSGSAKKLTPAREDKPPKEYAQDQVQWVAISNTYFTAILDARGPEGGGHLNTYQLVSDTSFLRYADEQQKRKIYATGLSLKLPPLLLGTGEEHTFNLALYIGPKEYARLGPLGYKKVMGTTFIATLASWLMAILNFIYKGIPNYGVAIILLTALIKVILFPLDRRSFKSMKEMQRIQPLIKELQAKFKDDKRQQQIEQMKLFKEHKVNPLGGCLPILLQFPVLFGMFTMLRNAVELWRAPFVGYVSDLSQPDTLFTIPWFPLLGQLQVHVLPILMTVFTILSQRLRGQGQTTDPQQKMMANLMPLIFLFIFYSFPSGLNLYWLCSTAFSFGVQLIVQRGDGKQVHMQGTPR
jgi:YidC/Oxa1 family membrane protein insertase